MAKWKKRVEGSPAQIGQPYMERERAYPYGARRRGSGMELAPQERSVDSFKKPVDARKEKERLDRTYVKSLQAKGLTVIDGGQRTVKGLDSIHAVKGIRHLGFGNFMDDNNFYDRADNPITGTRFYIKRSQDPSAPLPQPAEKPKKPVDAAKKEKQRLIRIAQQTNSAELRRLNQMYLDGQINKETYDQSRRIMNKHFLETGRVLNKDAAIKYAKIEKEFLQIVKRPSFRGNYDTVYQRICKKHGVDPFKHPPEVSLIKSRKAGSPKKSKKPKREPIEENPEFQAGYDKGLQEAALGKYRGHNSKGTAWKKGYDAGWRKAFKDPKYDEIVLINTEEDLTAWEKRRAVMESPEFQAWLAERWHTHPIPSDPYRAFMIDKSLKARLKEKPEWAQRVNVADWHPVDYPPITKEPPPDVAVPSPKTVEAEKTKEKLRIHSKYLAENMGIPEPKLHFTVAQGSRARSFYRSGYALHRYTGELVKVAEPEIVIGISGSRKISPENYAVLSHEMGHHKQVKELERRGGRDAVLHHYKNLNRRQNRIKCERSAWSHADPFLKEHRPAQKWLKKYAFGTYVGTTPGFKD